jgi:glycosyltransferase involved in cell wall biosynthesis
VTRVGVFHPGAQNSWQRALAAQEAGALAWYASTAHLTHDGFAMTWAGRLAGERGRALLARRSCAQLDPAYLRRLGCLEWAEIALRRLHLRGPAAAVNAWGNARFGRQVTWLADREPVDLLWTHNDGAAEAFARARARGIRCVLDQSIGHPAALAETLARDRARYPALHAGAPPPPDARAIARADRELALADLVLVGSAFARDTLSARGVDPARVRVVPYGFDETLWPAPAARPALRGRPLEVLFVGSVQPRKGVGALLDAFAGIDPRVARLTLLGRMDLPRHAFAPFAARVAHRPAVARQRVAAAMAAADVVILPSLFEGGGVVAYEALASGCALIQSASMALAVAPGRTGLVLDEVGAPAIRAAVEGLAHAPDRLAAMQTGARAVRTRSWADYRAEVRGVLRLDAPHRTEAAA